MATSGDIYSKQKMLTTLGKSDFWISPAGLLSLSANSVNQEGHCWEQARLQWAAFSKYEEDDWNSGEFCCH